MSELGLLSRLRWPWWAHAGALLISLNAMMVAPEWWMPYTGFPEPLIALESVLIVGAFLMLPLTIAYWLAPIASLVVLVGLGLALSDLGMGWALGRPLNLAIDLPLALSVEHLLRGALGRPAAIVVLLLGALTVAALVVGLTRGLWRLSQPMRDRGWRIVGGVCLLVLAGGLAAPSARSIADYVDTPVNIRLTDQVDRLMHTLAAREEFAQALDGDAALSAAKANFAGLKQRDVVLAFVESYGVSFIHDPRYRQRSQGTLQAMRAAFDAAGLGVVSASLRSPVQGGQSWLAHASVLSGHWINDQIRYDLYLEAGAPSLIRDFAQAGYQTAAIMPAITKAWPAGEQWGYDQIHDAARINYAGPALNWVTMPDQYTWHYFESEVRAQADVPLFAELALISSHAPWTPILPQLDWDLLSDGRLFTPWAQVGPTPAALWSDQARIQRYYARAVDYALRTAAQWAQRALDDGVLVLLGDHQAAPLITGEGASRDVPVHVISADPQVLEALVQRGFKPGLSAPEHRLGSLADLRGHFIAAWGGMPIPETSAHSGQPSAMAPSPQNQQESVSGR